MGPISEEESCIIICIICIIIIIICIILYYSPAPQEPSLRLTGGHIQTFVSVGAWRVTCWESRRVSQQKAWIPDPALLCPNCVSLQVTGHPWVCTPCL